MVKYVQKWVFLVESLKIMVDLESAYHSWKENKKWTVSFSIKYILQK